MRFSIGFIIATLAGGFHGGAIRAGETGNDDTLKIAFAGDAMCHQPQISAAYRGKAKGYDFTGVFAPIKSQLSEPDLMIANLETTLPGDSRKIRGYPLFGTDDAFAEALKAGGVDVLATANNHCVDSFKPGLTRTIETLGKMGIHQLGTYASEDDWKKRRVLVIEKKGFRIALLNYTYSTNGIPVPEGVRVNLIEEEAIAADLEAARSKKPDAIIVIYHWGWEYNRYPNSRQKQLAQFSFENGADVVLGAHPHVVQPFESKIVTDRFGETKQRIVLYSAGNFVSNMQRSHTKGGIIFHFNLVRNPDPDHPQRVLFQDVGYQSTWVYRSYTKSGRRYYLLPVDEYLQGKGPMKVPSYELAKMKQHARDNAALLKKGVASVESVEAKLAGKAPGQVPTPPAVAVAAVAPKPESTPGNEPEPPSPKPKVTPLPPPPKPGDFKPSGEITLTMKLVARSSPGEIPSGNVLGLFDYEVVSLDRGEYPFEKIRVADGYAFNGRLSAPARRPIGAMVNITLVPLATYPALAKWKMLEGDAASEKAMIYTPKLN